LATQPLREPGARAVQDMSPSGIGVTYTKRWLRVDFVRDDSPIVA
jgi:hypothetical protein